MGDLAQPPLDILEFPPEIREIIWNKLSQKDIYSLRLVSHAFLQDVDTLYKYRVFLTNSIPDSEIRRLFDLKLNYLYIMQCKTIPSQPPESRNTILKYPTVDSLWINSFTIDPDLILQYLTPSAKYVKNLHFSLGPVQLNHAFDFKFDFKNLQKLILTLTDRYEEERIQRESMKPHLIRCLRESTLPQLKSIDIFLTLATLSRDGVIDWVSAAFKLISDQSLLLEELSIYLPLPHPLRNTSTEVPLKVRSLDIANFRQITGLKKVEIFNETKVGTKEWKALVLRQTKLRKLKLRKFPGEMALTDRCFYQSVILKNEATLVEIKIEDLGLTADSGPLDLTIFRNCTGLEVLTLSHTVGSERRAIPDQLDIVNFKALPHTLRTLDINLLRIQSSELLDFCSGELKILKSLRSISLHFSGDGDLLGISPECLNKILDAKIFPELGQLSVHRAMKVSSELEDSELVKLISVLAGYGHVVKFGPRSCPAYYDRSRLSFPPVPELNFDLVKDQRTENKWQCRDAWKEKYGTYL